MRDHENMSLAEQTEELFDKTDKALFELLGATGGSFTDILGMDEKQFMAVKKSVELLKEAKTLGVAEAGTIDQMSKSIAAIERRNEQIYEMVSKLDEKIDKALRTKKE